MNPSVKPQPLIAEILPGLVTLGAVLFSYFSTHRQQLDALAQSPNAAALLAGLSISVLFAAWIIGTFLDALRNVCEWPLDWLFRIDWSFLQRAPADEVRKLEESFLAYYFVDGNYVAGLAILLVLKASGLLQLPTWPILIVLLVFLADAVLLRLEIKKLIDDYNKRSSSPPFRLPHVGVYTRLGLSQIDQGGVGVIAIQPIKKGTYIFEPDDDEMVWVAVGAVESLPEPLQRLYRDFAVLRDGRYGCPSSFNRLTPAWYLNNSKNPNVACAADYRFYALRDIEVGEELTADYDAYSENPESPKT